MEAALSGPQGRTILGPEPLRLGRAPDNSLIVGDPQSSSHHAEVTPGPDGASYVVTDLGSTNGTFVNEQRLTPRAPQVLRAGDVLRIGETRYAYEVTGAIDSTVRADASASSSPGYDPTVYAAPPSSYSSPSSPSTVYGSPSVDTGYPPPSSPYDNAAPPPPQPDYGYQPQSGYPASQPGYAPQSQPGYPPAEPYVPQSQPGYPPMQPGGYGPGGVPAFQPPPQRSKAGMWTAIIIVAVLVVGGGLFAILSMNGSTPQKTMDAYCTAYKNGDANAMYDLLSTNAKQKQTKEDLQTLMTQIKSAGGIQTCTTSDVTESGSTATGKIHLTLAGKTVDATDQLVKENGTWKLEGENGD
jgi:hypothetical protein